MSVESRTRLLCAVVLGALSFAIAPACLDLREQAAPNDDTCTRCHGDITRAGSALQRSAPPYDLKGNGDVEYPGIGAHDVHLKASDTHAAVACTECHVVPEAVDSPGHLDAELPAEVHFGELAQLDSPRARYDAEARTCANTYCHGELSAVWTRPRSSQQACGSCHGLPPAAPHPQAQECSQCHGQVVNGSSEFVAPDLHIDGTLQLTEPGCSDCHGSEDNAAPPRALNGGTDRQQRGVGAHQVHLSGGEGSRPVPCAECHPVPDEPYSDGHLDGSGLDLVFSAVGEDTTYDVDSGVCASRCHGTAATEGTSPPWTSTVALGCDGCHDDPPLAPHPQSGACNACHGEVVNEDRQIVSNLHVDGIVQVDTPDSCVACHGRVDGDELGAPPKDTLDNLETSSDGVGAHQAHLVGRGLARVLTCNECHAVPETVQSEGHLDSALPAEVVFSGVALSFGALPKYDNGICADSYCHGADFVFQAQPSGGRFTEPRWTQVDGSQVTCEGCHAMPPPAPHPTPAEDCGECHRNAIGNSDFSHPERHVDGELTFYLNRQDAESDLLGD